MKRLQSLLQKIFIEESKAERNRIYGLSPDSIRGFRFKMLHGSGIRLPHVIHSLEINHGVHDNGNIFRDVSLLVGLQNRKHRNFLSEPEYIESLSSSLNQILPQEKFKLDKKYQEELDEVGGGPSTHHGVIAMKSRIIGPESSYTYNWRTPNIDRPGGDPRSWSSATG